MGSDKETTGQQVAREWEASIPMQARCLHGTLALAARIDAAVAEELAVLKAEMQAIEDTVQDIATVVAEARAEGRAVCLAIAQAAADAMRDHEGCPLSAGEPCGDCGYVDGCDDVAAAIRARGKS